MRECFLKNQKGIIFGLMIPEFRSHFDQFLNTDFRRSLAVLTSGNLIAQVIGLLSYPILSRLYPDDVFGQFALFNSIAALMGLMITLRYEVAIPLPTENEVAVVIKRSAGWVAFILTLILTVITVVIETFHLFPSLSPFIYFIPIVAFTISLIQINRFWCLRINQLMKYFAFFIGHRLFYAVLAICLPLFLELSNGLITSLIISSVLIAVVMGAVSTKASFKYPEMSQAREVLSRYQRFPKFVLPTFLVAHITNQVPIFLLAYFFNESITGQYSVAFSLLMLPQGLLMMRISESAYQNFRTLKIAEIRKRIFKIWRIMAPITFLTCLLLFILGEDVMVFLLGNQWQLAGQISEYFAVLIFASSFYTPLASMMNLFELESIRFKLAVFKLIWITASFVIAGIYGDLFLGIKIYLVFGIINQGLLLTTLVRRLMQDIEISLD